MSNTKLVRRIGVSLLVADCALLVACVSLAAQFPHASVVESCTLSLFAAVLALLVLRSWWRLVVGVLFLQVGAVLLREVSAQAGREILPMGLSLGSAFAALAHWVCFGAVAVVQFTVWWIRHALKAERESREKALRADQSAPQK